VGSIPISRSIIFLCFIAHIAQAVEHFLGKEEVTSSSLVVGTIYLAFLLGVFLNGKRKV
jgi:hypothetical protein